MRDCTQFYIDGQWVDPVTENTVAVENPATEEKVAELRRYHAGLIAMYHPHQSFLESDNPRIRGMVAPLVEMGLA